MTALIGESTTRTDGEAKVRGEAIYGVDYAEAGMLHAKLLRSPLPAGRILLLDTAEAERLPGVHGIFTARDAPADLAGAVVRDQRLFAVDVVRYEGEPIAAVVAETPGQAQAAVEAIRLELEPTPPAGDLEAALADHALLVHPEWESYVQTPDIELGRCGNLAAGQTILVPSRATVLAAADVPNPALERYPRRAKAPAKKPAAKTTKPKA